jgi:hypothetical protein
MQGAERAFYLSNDAGNSWQQFQLNLPIVPVTDLMIRDNDLVAATAGRAFWILDDLSAIQQSAANLKDSSLQLFQPKASYKYGGGNGLPEANYNAGQNAPEGVIFDYVLPKLGEKDTLSLSIVDAAGKTIRTYTNQEDEKYSKYPGGPAPKEQLSAAKGHNRFLWDFRSETVQPDVKGVYIYGNYSGYGVAPGNYTAKLTHHKTVKEVTFKVLPNPGITASEADWKEQQTILETITASISEIHQSVIDLRKVKQQLEQHAIVYKDNKQADSLVSQAKVLVKNIDAWEANIVESRIKNGQDVINWPSKINAEFFNIKGVADAANPKITSGLKNRLSDLQKEWAGEKEKLQGIKQSIKAYNQLYQSKQLDAIQF